MYKNTKNDKQFDIIYKFLVTFFGILWYTNIVYQKMGRKLKNEQKKKEKGLKSF